MFTGLIEEIGRIETITRSSFKNSISISCQKILEDLKLGDSIAVNGICLTVNSFNSKGFTADVMPVTFNKSSLNKARIGDHVNLERALQLQSRLGGHLVSGHIDGVGRIQSRINHGNAFLLKISVDQNQSKFMIPEGSVCIDGISLTIVELCNEFLTVSLIPETMNNTILQYKKVGDEVNIESDMVGKYLYNFQKNKPNKNISMNLLKENGFV
jgi:riboflavin synthase